MPYTPRDHKTYAPGTYQTAACYPAPPPSTCEWVARELHYELDKKCIGQDPICRAKNTDIALDAMAYCANLS